MVNRNEEKLVCDCNFSGIKPAVMDLPYPQVRVRERNQDYAGLIGVSYCGMISELSACLQYINNESRMVSRGCAMGKILLGMAVAEMQHMRLAGGECLLHCKAGGRPALDVDAAVPDTARQT